MESNVDQPVTVIGPRSGWKLIDFNELKGYRDLFLFMVWRDIKVLYAQTVLGFAWAILQPLIQIILFTVIFGRVAKISTDGIPYMLFSSVGIIPWTYISQAITHSSQSLVTGQNMLGKIYFPRVIFPISPVLSHLVDFAISIVILLAMMVYYRVMPTWNLLMLPVFVVLMVAFSAGAGMWLSAMAIRFRDVKHALNFLIRMLMFSAPIVYSASSISSHYRFIYSLNPIVAVVEGFRACLLGTDFAWGFIVPGIITGIMILLSGALYFNRMEKVFADVI
jgi:lipopolysaccharide transport system permease protein